MISLSRDRFVCTGSRGARTAALLLVLGCIFLAIILLGRWVIWTHRVSGPMQLSPGSTREFALPWWTRACPSSHHIELVVGSCEIGTWDRGEDLVHFSRTGMRRTRTTPVRARLGRVGAMKTSPGRSTAPDGECASSFDLEPSGIHDGGRASSSDRWVQIEVDEPVQVRFIDVQCRAN